VRPNIKPFIDRRIALLLGGLSGVLLAACVSTPPAVIDVAAPVAVPVVSAKAARTTALFALGFEKTDEGFVLNLPGPLLFESGSDVLSVAAKAVIAKLAADVRALGIDSVRLYGHTDNVGSVEFNRGLSTKRAEAVAVAMMGHGFAAGTLERRGFGFDRPIASNDTPEGRTKNRRVAVIVPFE
jgi:outer membrane protein OmpA-like peptidoglycan-associated protein